MPATAKRWKVIGGGDKGGILVKKEKSVNSASEKERLATGSIIKEVNLNGDRLGYRLVTGSGPISGWVTWRLPDKELCVPIHEEKAEEEEVAAAPAAAPAPETPTKESKPASTGPSEEPPVPSSAPRCLQRACDIAAPLTKTPVLPAAKKYMVLKKLLEAAEKRLPGDMYGLPFPQCPEEMFDDPKFGVDWLTKAFHAAGTLPKDNKVARVVQYHRFPGGGSGPKSRFTVEYETPDESLDTLLFSKHPYPVWENQQQRYIEEGQLKFGDNWGGEISFYRFLSPYVPFAVPKYYFGDLSRESTEAILINACVTWPEKGKTEFEPYEVLPPCGKCEDYLLTNPQDYYFAVMRRLGTFTGLAKSKKLGPDLENINWYNCGVKQDVNAMAGFPDTEKNIVLFVEQVAPHWFSEKVRSKQYLDAVLKNFKMVNENHQILADFIYADPLYIGLFHQNGNTDNVYFYKRQDGTIDTGILDWGSTASMAMGSGFMGSTISALAEMLAEHDEAMIRVFVDAYHATGAPKIKYEELLLRYRVSTCISAYGIFNTANNYCGPRAIDSSKEWFKTLPAYNCDEIRANFSNQFMFSMLYNRIVLFALKGETYWSAAQQVLKQSAKK